MTAYWGLVVDFIRDPRLTLPRVPFILSVLALFLWPAVRYRITRRDVDRFAARQHLVVTPENGALIARALAISFRWRRFGFAWGVVISVIMGMLLAPLYPISLKLNYAIVFLGWFAGALAGEWRIASKPVAVGARRVAGLTTRSVASYVTRSNRVVLAVVIVILAGAVGYGAFVEPMQAGKSAPWPFLVLLAVTTGLLWATFRRVTQRPQPFVDDAAREADDALRAHSLTVLVGCVIAVSGWLVFLILNGTELGRVPFLVPMAGLGWWVAARSRSPRARSIEGRAVVGEVAET
ncbi:MAG TPA: hypothetical protein VFY29_08135 [Terriglobia bacterium]|nr:hypothetical protein [Terriglobia bacterium]